jgi:hypothetical protein
MIARTRDERVLISLILGCLLSVIAAFGVMLVEGCKPGVTPASILTQVEGIVQHDVEAGDSLLQVQKDVATAISQDVGSPLVAMLLDDALQALIDAEVLAPAALAQAKALQTQIHPLAVGARAGR